VKGKDDVEGLAESLDRLPSVDAAAEYMVGASRMDNKQRGDPDLCSAADAADTAPSRASRFGMLRAQPAPGGNPGLRAASRCRHNGLLYRSQRGRGCRSRRVLLRQLRP
jgi:hypothetical protein